MVRLQQQYLLLVVSTLAFIMFIPSLNRYKIKQEMLQNNKNNGAKYDHNKITKKRQLINHKSITISRKPLEQNYALAALKSIPFWKGFIANYSHKIDYTSANNETSSINLLIFIYIDSNITNNLPLYEYDLAVPTVECYTLRHGYNLVAFDHSHLPKVFYKQCKHLKRVCFDEPLLFRKHCVAAQLLKLHNEVDWMLVQDADVGIVNPHQSLDRFLSNSTDLIFYERFFDWEIASGNYLVRNTHYAIQFLTQWAAYDIGLPTGQSSEDNGALQIHLLKTLLPDNTNEHKTCENMWRSAQNWPQYHSYVSCVKVSLGARRIWPHIQLLRRGHAWVIDRDVVYDQWCDQMIMFHGWKRKQLKVKNRWPFSRQPKDAECEFGSKLDWPIRKGFEKVPCENITQTIFEQEKKWQGVFKKYVVYHIKPDVGLCWPHCDSPNNTNTHNYTTTVLP